MIRTMINGNWEDVPNEHLQIGSKSFAFDCGLYETFRTLNFQPLFLDPHLNRLLTSAKKIDLKIHYPKMEIIKMVDTVILEFPDPEQRVRILVAPDQLILYTSPLNLDPAVYNGVKVITVTAKRNTPDVKTTDYHTCLSAWEKANKVNCFEAILSDKNGNLYEGSKSNLFWVQDGKLFTRKDQILPGVTRQTIISKSLLPVFFGQLNKNNIHQINELFITNSGSGIVPVTHINNQIIGNGNVGEITILLLKQYEKWIKEDLNAVNR